MAREPLGRVGAAAEAAWAATKAAVQEDLKAQVAALQTQVAALQTQVSVLQDNLHASETAVLASISLSRNNEASRARCMGC